MYKASTDRLHIKIICVNWFMIFLNLCMSTHVALFWEYIRCELQSLLFYNLFKLEFKPFFSHTHETRFLWFPFYFLSYFLLLNAKHALKLQNEHRKYTHTHTRTPVKHCFLFISFKRRYATFNYTYFTPKKKSTQKYATLAKMKINEKFRSPIRYSLNLRSLVIVIHYRFYYSIGV